MTTLQTPLTTTSVLTSSGTATIGKLNIYDTTAGALTVTLPALSGLNVGARLAVCKYLGTNAPTNSVQINFQGTDYAEDGVTQGVALRLQGERREFQVISVGGTKRWHIVGGVPIIYRADRPRAESIRDTYGNISVAIQPNSGTGANYINVFNGTSGNYPAIAATGSDADVYLSITPKGAASVGIGDGGGRNVAWFRGASTNTNINNLEFSNAATTVAPSVGVGGSDTHISLNLVSKGTGTVKANSVDVVTTTGTQTLTNKSLTSPTITGAPQGVAPVNTNSTAHIMGDVVGTRPIIASIASLPVNSFIIPALHNDLAYATLRGTTVSVTVNGTPTSTYAATLPSCFRPGQANVDISGVLITDVVVVEVDHSATTTYTGACFYGIDFRQYSAPPNVTIEAWDTVASSWVTVTTATASTSGSFGGYLASVNNKTKFRITMSGATTHRIMQIYTVLPVSSSGAAGVASSLLPRAGGAMYGSTAAPPTFTATGSDSNIGINLVPKGTGAVTANGVDVVTTTGTQTLTNKTLTAPTVTGTEIHPNTGAIEIYNTADQTTNYEKLSIKYANSAYEIGQFYGGTGARGIIRIGGSQVAGTTALGKYIEINSLAQPFMNFLTATSGSGNQVQVTGGGSASSSNQTMLAVNCAMSQTGTAGYTGLLVSSTETTVGSGTKLLADFQVGGVSKAKIDNTGVITSAVGTATGSVVTVDGTQTLTNKTITSASLNGSTSVGAIVASSSYVRTGILSIGTNGADINLGQANSGSALPTYIDFNPSGTNVDYEARIQCVAGDGTQSSGTLSLYAAVIKANGNPVMVNVAAPATATSTGVAGQHAYDSSYVYVCTATNTWKRAALSTW